MSYVKTVKQTLGLILMLAGLSACDIQDDLIPSNSDKRSNVTIGSAGHLPGQIAADFTIKDSLDNDFILSDYLEGGSKPADLVVLYYTMWCPICLSHTDHMYNNVLPQFRDRGTVVYGLVDYVSGSVSATRAAEQANGYAGSNFTILSDEKQALLKQFNGAMGIVVIIDSDGTILLNEDYRNGSSMIEILDQQLP